MTCFTSTGRDLRRNPIEERKALLRRVLDRVRCPHQIYVDHVLAGAPICSTTCARSAPRGSSLSAPGPSEGHARLAQDQVPRHRPIYRYRLPGTRARQARGATPVAAGSPRACQDTRSFNKHCATTTSPRSVSLDFMFLTKLNPVYVTRMPGSEGGVAL